MRGGGWGVHVRACVRECVRTRRLTCPLLHNANKKIIPQLQARKKGETQYVTSRSPAKTTYRNGRGERLKVCSGCPSDGIATRSDVRKSFGSLQS
jgi:hypothetical protein